MRFHDIRHQIRHLSDGSEPGEGYVDRELLADIAREVRIYDASVTTGNEALDVLLTEKRLTGEHEDIAFSCIVDGEALSFMGPSDLYARARSCASRMMRSTSSSMRLAVSAE